MPDKKLTLEESAQQISEAVTSFKAQLNVLVEIQKAREVIDPEKLTFAQRVAALKHKGIVPLDILRIPLSVARNQEVIAQAGTFLYVHRIVDSSGTDVSGTIDVKLNRNDQQNPIRLAAGQGIRADFHQFFITNTATSGAIAEILIVQDERFAVVDNRLSTSISTLTSLTNITGTIAGLTGALPAGATAVNVRTFLQNAGLTTMYTVTAAKTLYIQNSGVVGETSGPGYTSLEHFDSGGTFKSQLCAGFGASGQAFLNHLPQRQAAAAETIRAVVRTNTGAALATGYGFFWFSGWEI